MNEQLSAFLDNEATPDESDSVVNALLRDKTLRDAWTRQHWIRTTLRAHGAESAVAIDTGFADRVMTAIAKDDHQESVAPAPRAGITPLVPSRRVRRWRGVAGFAAAASVAGVVMLAGNPFLRGSSSSEGRVASARDAGTAATRVHSSSDDARAEFGSGHWNDRLADFSSVSASPSRRQARVVATTSASGAAQSDVSAADHWSVSDPDVRHELNGYLADHDGMARGYGMSGTTPALVRVATYDQDVAR